jgi:type I restriction enzyme S subunit
MLLKNCVVKISIKRKIKKNDYLENGLFPVIDQGHKFIGGYTNDRSARIVVNEPLIVFGDHTRIIKFVNFDFTPGADGIKVFKPLPFYDAKYFAYILQAIKLPDKGYSRHYQYLEKSEIPICPFSEQKRIVAKIESLFSRLDSAKDSLERVQQKIKRYRQSVLKSAFEGKLIGSTGMSEEVELKDIILESMIGLVRSNNKQNYLNIGIPYIKMNNIDMEGNLNLENIAFVKVSRDEITRYSLRKGDLLVNTRNSYELVGKSAVVREDSVVRVYNNNIVRLRFKKCFNPYFVGFQMIAPRVQKEMKLGKKATTNICALYHKDLFPLKFKIYSYEQQVRIVSAIESRFERTKVLEDAVEQGLEKIERLKQSILKKAFEGKLVEPDSNGELVGALLERIKKEKAKLVKV